MSELISKKCPNCGATISTDVCPYCNIDSNKNSEKKFFVYDAVEVRFNFSKQITAVFFGILASFTGIFLPMLFASSSVSSFKEFIQNSVPYFFAVVISSIIVFICLFIAFSPFIRSIKLALLGKDIEATVFGYMNDNTSIGGEYRQILKILMTTENGYEMIYDSLDTTEKPYEVNSKIQLRIYKRIFKIKNRIKYKYR